HEFEAIRAMRALGASAHWDEHASLPQGDVYSALQALPSQTIVNADTRASGAAPARMLDATYRRAYQMHGAIGPSCAIGLYQDDALTVWTHSQGVYPLRASIAEMLRMPSDRVHCIHAEGSGCYGHNAADDAAAHAALLARAMPARPVRVQWMREQEHTFEPYGPAMIAKVRAGLDASGNVVEWDFEGWSNSHSNPPRSRFRCRKAAATAIRSRTTRCRMSMSYITSFRACRYACRRCARSAPTRTCSRSKASSTSSQKPPAPIRSLSGFAI